MVWRNSLVAAVVVGIGALIPQGVFAQDYSYMLGGVKPAQDLTGTWELGAQVGGLLMDNQSRLEPHMLSGGQLGYYLTNETELEFSMLAGKVTDRGIPDDGLSNVSGRVMIPTAEVLYYGCSEGPFRPFVAAGVGAVIFDDTRDNDGGDVALNLGGGAKWFVTEQAALRLDGRWLVNTAGGPELHEATLTGGLSWHFNDMM